MSRDTLQEVTYLGDSVYAGHDGYQVWIWTDNGFGPLTPTTGIALEYAVLLRLMRYAADHLKPPEEADHAAGT